MNNSRKRKAPEEPADATERAIMSGFHRLDELQKRSVFRALIESNPVVGTFPPRAHVKEIMAGVSKDLRSMVMQSYTPADVEREIAGSTHAKRRDLYGLEEYGNLRADFNRPAAFGPGGNAVAWRLQEPRPRPPRKLYTTSSTKFGKVSYWTDRRRSTLEPMPPHRLHSVERFAGRPGMYNFDDSDSEVELTGNPFLDAPIKWGNGAPPLSRADRTVAPELAADIEYIFEDYVEDLEVEKGRT